MQERRTQMDKGLGNYGESLAEIYFINKGHCVLERNYSCRFGEIDIITRYNGIIHFNEVKTVYHTNFHPLEQVTAKKIGRLIRAMHYYIKSQGLGDVDISLNALGIIISDAKPPSYFYEENITL